MGESAEAVERLARRLLLRQRRDRLKEEPPATYTIAAGWALLGQRRERLCGVLLRPLVRRVEQADDGRDRVEIGEQRA